MQRREPSQLTMAWSQWSKNRLSPVSKPAIVPMPLPVSSKSKTSRFSAIRSGLTDLGIMTALRWTSQRRTTWPTDLPWAAAIAVSVGR